MNKKIKDIFIKNFTNLSFNQGINILIAIVVTPILFQNLGSSQFGLVNLAFSIFMLISIFVSYGYHLNGPAPVPQAAAPLTPGPVRHPSGGGYQVGPHSAFPGRIGYRLYSGRGSSRAPQYVATPPVTYDDRPGCPG